jgi:hypothetical protein
MDASDDPAKSALPWTEGFGIASTSTTAGYEGESDSLVARQCGWGQAPRVGGFSI